MASRNGSGWGTTSVIRVGRVPADRIRDASIGAASLMGILVIWEASRGVSDLSPLLPYPTQVFAALVDLLAGTRSEEFRSALGATASVFVQGFALAGVFGCVLGFGLGRYRTLRTALYPYVFMLHASPRIALLPLLIIWFGIGQLTALVMVILSSAFTITIGVAEGVQNSSSNYLEVARSFGARERHVILKVVLPASAGYTMEALRLGAGRGIIGVLGAELFLRDGLGLLLTSFSLSLALDYAMAVVVTIAALGVLVMGAFGSAAWYVRTKQGGAV